MALKTEKTERNFYLGAVKLSDPDRKMSAKEVCEFYSNSYPELGNATPKGPTYENGIETWKFERVIGQKG